MTTKIPRNKPCPCGSGIHYKHCCGNESVNAEEVYASIHELGHLSVLSPAISPHSSFCNPCNLCVGDEGQEKSLAHTGYPPGHILECLDEIIYSLAGGAAEVACGLSPLITMTKLGSLPKSMETDIENLKAALPDNIFRALNPVNQYFNRIVRHFEHHSEILWRYSRIFREKKTLTSTDVDLSILGREELYKKFEKLFGL